MVFAMDTVNPDRPGEPGRPDIRSGRAILRAHWEIAGALALMVAVLVVLDTVSLGRPELILSCAPIVFLGLAAFCRMEPVHLGAWTAACVALALAMGDWRFVGLAYPAVVLAVLIAVHRRLRRPR
jgi:hypothetical protein